MLILAGITISTLAGENGLISRVQQARQAYTQAEMKEQLALALQNLQAEKQGNATLDDITQEWIDAQIQDYECTVKEDASTNSKKITMQKDGIEYKTLIDESLNITEIEQNKSSIELTYETKSKDEEDNIAIVITISDKENGLDKIEFPDDEIIYCNGQEEVSKDYTVKLGESYIVKITSMSGEEKEETIQISDYYYKITKTFDDGVIINNEATKAAYNKPYEATITTTEDYMLKDITVKMAGETLTDMTTENISISTVTGDIEIIVTTKKIYANVKPWIQVYNGSIYSYGKDNVFSKFNGANLLEINTGLELIESFETGYYTNKNVLILGDNKNIYIYDSSDDKLIGLTLTMKFSKVGMSNYKTERGVAIDESGNIWTATGSRNLINVSTQWYQETDMAETGIGFKDASIDDDGYLLAIDNDGYLWAKGSIYYLNGTSTINYSKLTKIKDDDNITDGEAIKFKNSKFTKVIYGYYAYFAIDENGNLWTAGQNNGYELGDGTINKPSAPRIIAGPDSSGEYKTKITDFDIGTYDGMAIDENGDIYAWGASLNEVIGKREFTKLSITENDNSVKFKYIAINYCGPFAAVSTDGYVYYCYQNSSEFKKIDGLRLW